MVDTRHCDLANLLRKRVSGFLASKARLKTPLMATLRRLSQEKLPAVIFGGALRDLMVQGPSTEPRDVDIVVDRASVDDLAKLFSDVLVRRTRFGGLHLNVRGWMIDVWPLGDTWALRQFRIGSGDFESLTRTTFLNVEAVIVDLSAPQSGRRRVYASGFFEALQTRVLDINLEENPYPELSAIRTLVTAAKLEFNLSKRLAEYVAYQIDKTPLEEFVDIQLKHYGLAKFDTDMIHRWSKIIEAQVNTQPVVRFPRQLQLPLWDDRTTAPLAS